MEDKRYTKKEILELYNIDRTTVEGWIKNHGFPMIVINCKSKYVREKDLLEWEDSMIKDIR